MTKKMQDINISRKALAPMFLGGVLFISLHTYPLKLPDLSEVNEEFESIEYLRRNY